jgi:hypothetical protein
MTRKNIMIAARGTVSELEEELESLTGKSAQTGTIRIRRESIPEEDLKRKIHDMSAVNETHGMNAKIAEAVGQSPICIRDFLKKNPKVLNREGKRAHALQMRHSNGFTSSVSDSRRVRTLRKAAGGWPA